MEPPGAIGDNMRHVHANRPVPRRGVQGRLTYGKGRDGRDKTLSVSSPTCVEGEERKLLFSHKRYSLLVCRRKKQHERSNMREETMGQKEEGRAGHRSRNDRIRG